MSNFCSQCGNKIAPNSSFCSACGAAAVDDVYGGSANPYEASAPVADEASYYAADADGPSGRVFGARSGTV